MTVPTICTQCAAVVRPDAAWCPLCFTQLSGGFDPLTAPIEDVLSQGGGTGTLTQRAQPAAEPAVAYAPPVEVPGPEPVVEPSGDSGGESAVELSDVDVMLAMLAAEHRQAEPSIQIVDRMGDKNARIVIMLGGTVAFTILGFVMLALLGALS